MGELDQRLRGYEVVSRDMVLAAGGTDAMIASRVRAGWWTRLHAGVYRIGPRSDRWLERLEAAVLAAGEGAVVSHRAAFALWGLDGIQTGLVEITVPYAHAPVPKGVIRHRTRRSVQAVVVHGLPTTTVERTLLDSAAVLPQDLIAKGVDSAVRLGLTDPLRLMRVVAEKGGPGVRGVRKVERAIDLLEMRGPTGSPAELELRRHMDDAGIPPPVPQWEVTCPSGRTYRVDFGWPDRDKGVEVDGVGAHSSAEQLERDLARQNDLLAAGIELRRFTGRQIRRNPQAVVTEIRQFLGLL
ncbi:MAG TPA: DUF559 domain-containing protein [Acidimicrobiia bacterium]|jgi:hypothetical protein